jgi:glycosyltransferase involved in cell wall biosynthesis
MMRQPKKTIVHVTASFLFGGPERQMLGLAHSLREHCRSVFVSFREGGLCRAFLERASGEGFAAVALEHDTPRLLAAQRELVRLLRNLDTDILCCHGYKANMLGLVAARRLGIPIVSVSRGWTGESVRVRVYEVLDRLLLRRMDRVVCVSAGQAEKVHRAGVPSDKTVVIRNAIRADRFAGPQEEYRNRLQRMFPTPPQRIVGAAGRLSPEKGFDVLVDAAAAVVRSDPSVGFVLFGEGALRGSLAGRIEATGLSDNFILAGFRSDLDRYLPNLDLIVVPSYSEGLPNIVLEAFAAGVPVVATAVGGTPEVVEDGISGYLVPPGDSPALADRIVWMLSDAASRKDMGLRGKERVFSHFTFASQAQQYSSLFAELTSRTVDGPRRDTSPMP